MLFNSIGKPTCTCNHQFGFLFKRESKHLFFAFHVFLIREDRNTVLLCWLSFNVAVLVLRRS